MNIVLLSSVLILFVMGFILPNVFATTETYDDNYLDFSVEIEDWWYVADATMTEVTFRGETGLGHLSYIIQFKEGVNSQDHSQGLRDIRNLHENFCSEFNCKFVSEHPLENAGIITIDKHKAYQIGHTFQVDSSSCSSVITTIPDENDSWSLIGFSCGKAHSNFIEALKDSALSFHSFRESTYTSTNSNPTYVPPTTYVSPPVIVPSATKTYTNTDLKFSINHPNGWLVEAYSDYVTILDVVTGSTLITVDYYENGVTYSDYSNSKKLTEIEKYERDTCMDSSFMTNGQICSDFTLHYSEVTKITDNYSTFSMGYSKNILYDYGDTVVFDVLLLEHHIGDEVWLVSTMTHDDMFSEYVDLMTDILLSFQPSPSPIKIVTSTPTTDSFSVTNKIQPSSTHNIHHPNLLAIPVNNFKLSELQIDSYADFDDEWYLDLELPITSSTEGVENKIKQKFSGITYDGVIDFKINYIEFIESPESTSTNIVSKYAEDYYRIFDIRGEKIEFIEDLPPNSECKVVNDSTGDMHGIKGVCIIANYVFDFSSHKEKDYLTAFGESSDIISTLLNSRYNYMKTEYDVQQKMIEDLENKKELTSEQNDLTVTKQDSQVPEQKVIENQTEELESSSTIPPLTNNVDVITYSEPDEILTSFLPSDYMKYNCGIGSCEFSKLSINEISDSSIEGLTSGIKQVYSQKNIDNIPALSKSTDRAFGITAGTDTFSDLSRGVYLDVQILEFDLQKNSQNYYDHITKSAINKGHLSNVFTECSFEHRGQPQDVGRYGVIDGMTTCQVQNYVVLSNVSTEVGGQAALETWYITEDYTYTPVQKTIKNIHNRLAQLDTNVLDMTPDSKNLVGQSNSIQVTGINIVKGSDYDLITMNLKGDIEFNQSNDLVQRTTEFALIDWELKKYPQSISESKESKTKVDNLEEYLLTGSGVQSEIITTKNLSFAFPNEKCTLDATINAQELGKPVESKVCFEIPKGKDHFQLIRIDEYSQSSGYLDKFIKTDSSNLVAQFDLDDIESSFGTMESMTDQSPNSSSNDGGGCLIATATYGSELAPQVQQLRELRDNQLLQTESGAAFMSTFNNVYYSFSPIIADYERENPLFKESVKLAITPMISSLSLMENANSESEVLGIGLSVIMLNIGMYLAVPAVLIVGIRKRI